MALRWAGEESPEHGGRPVFSAKAVSSWSRTFGDPTFRNQDLMSATDLGENRWMGRKKCPVRGFTPRWYRDRKSATIFSSPERYSMRKLASARVVRQGRRDRLAASVNPW